MFSLVNSFQYTAYYVPIITDPCTLMIRFDFIERKKKNQRLLGEENIGRMGVIFFSNIIIIILVFIFRMCGMDYSLSVMCHSDYYFIVGGCAEQGECVLLLSSVPGINFTFDTELAEHSVPIQE